MILLRLMKMLLQLLLRLQLWLKCSGGLARQISDVG